MSIENLLGILTSYLIYLVFVFLMTRKKMDRTKQIYCGIRLLSLFLGAYFLLEFLTHKVDYALFFAVSFAAFVYVAIVDTLLMIFGASISKPLLKYIFGREDI